MAASELSVDQIHKYLLDKGGIVSNREVVRYFRKYLTDPLTQDDARAKFKKFVNVLATTKSEGNEKFLILRQKYSVPLEEVTLQNDPKNALALPTPSASPSPSPSISVSDFSPNASPIPRQPPPYRPPPPVTSPSPLFDNISLSSSNMSLQEQSTPQAPPRRKNSERSMDSDSSLLKSTSESTLNDESDQQEADKSISVKERTQKFNRMASIEDVLSLKQQKKKQLDKGVDEDDGASVSLLDTKRCAEWYVTAAKGEYLELAKLASNEPKFVKLKLRNRKFKSLYFVNDASLAVVPNEWAKLYSTF